MNLVENILIREDGLFVSDKYLMHLGINESTVRANTCKYNNGTIATFRNIKINKTRFVAYDSINWSDIKPFKDGTPVPDKQYLIDGYYKDLEASKKASRQELIDKLPEHWAHHYNPADERYFRETYKVNEGRGGDHSRSEDLATQLAILRFLSGMTSKHLIKEMTGFETKKDLQEGVCTWLKQLPQPMYHMVTNYDNLRKLVNSYKTHVQQSVNDHSTDKPDVRDFVLHGNIRNTNSKKLDEKQWLIIQEYYFTPQGISEVEAYDRYKDYMIDKLGYTENQLIGISRMRQLVTTSDMKLIAAKVRDGSAYYDAKYRPFVLGKPPQYSMSLVSGDGWEPGRSVKFKHYNKKSKRWENRVGTMNVWWWMDWKSKYWISHRVSGYEEGRQIRLSFRDIPNLHDGLVPRSVMIDKKWMKNEDINRMMKKCGVMFQDKAAYSPKTNLIESSNKINNKLHRHLDEYWVDITNNDVRYKHNEDHVRGAKPLEEEEFQAMVMKIRDRYNHTPLESLDGLTPHEAFHRSISPDCKSIDPLQLAWVFGDHKIVTVRNYTVSISLSTKKYVFVIPNKDKKAVTREIGKDWQVKVFYDERHMESVDIYAFKDKDTDLTDRYLCTCKNAELVAVNKSKIETLDDADQAEKLGEQQAGVNIVDSMIDDWALEKEELAKKHNIDLASVKGASQDRFKKVHELEVVKQYRNYYSEEADVVLVETQPAKKKASKSDRDYLKKKRKALEQEVGDMYSED